MENITNELPEISTEKWISPYATDAQNLLLNLNQKPHTETLFRDKVIRQLMAVLISANKPNALLIGSAGCGKTKIVEELAYRIKNKDASITALLRGYTIYSLQISDIVAGSGIVGELEEKVNALLDFLSEESNKAILFMDEVHMLFGNDSYKKIAQILKPALSRGQIKVIAATTTQEVKQIDTDPAFNRRFTRVLVDELTKEQTEDILLAQQTHLQQHYGMPFAFNRHLAKLTIDIADEFCFVGSHRPDNALSLLDRAVADALIETQTTSVEQLELTEELIKKTAFKITSGNSEIRLFDEVSFRNALSVIQGQDDIIEDIVRTIKLHDMHIRPRKKPLTFLFAGASGVGKTEVTKILANSYIGEKPIILNMAEYHSSASINRIIGAPAGYVGFDNNSELPFDALETNPYQVILLDEFEKCDRSVQRLFMSVFDEGILKTNSGKLIDFSKAIIIATTNAGCSTSKGTMGFLLSQTDTLSISALSEYFDVELLNRFSHKYAFHNISKSIYRDILQQTYTSQIQQLKSMKGVAVEGILDAHLNEQLLNQLVEASFEPQLGARPIHTVVTEYIDNQILQGGGGTK